MPSPKPSDPSRLDQVVAAAFSASDQHTFARQPDRELAGRKA